MRFNLPDRDVFEIDADAPTPAAVDGLATCANGAGCWASVGTMLFNMVVNPSNGKIYVSNTEAKNQTRFEGPGTVASAVKPAGEPPTVQGNLAQSRITVLDGSNVDVRHLNKHLDYSVLKAPAADKAKSLSTPTAMAVDGSDALRGGLRLPEDRRLQHDRDRGQHVHAEREQPHHALRRRAGGPDRAREPPLRAHALRRLDRRR